MLTKLNFKKKLSGEFSLFNNLIADTTVSADTLIEAIPTDHEGSYTVYGEVVVCLVVAILHDRFDVITELLNHHIKNLNRYINRGNPLEYALQKYNSKSAHKQRYFNIILHLLYINAQSNTKKVNKFINKMPDNDLLKKLIISKQTFGLNQGSMAAILPADNCVAIYTALNRKNEAQLWTYMRNLSVLNSILSGEVFAKESFHSDAYFLALKATIDSILTLNNQSAAIYDQSELFNASMLLARAYLIKSSTRNIPVNEQNAKKYFFAARVIAAKNNFSLSQSQEDFFTALQLISDETDDLEIQTASRDNYYKYIEFIAGIGPLLQQSSVEAKAYLEHISNRGKWTISGLLAKYYLNEYFPNDETKSLLVQSSQLLRALRYQYGIDKAKDINAALVEYKKIAVKESVTNKTLAYIAYMFCNKILHDKLIDISAENDAENSSKIANISIIIQNAMKNSQSLLALASKSVDPKALAKNFYRLFSFAKYASTYADKILVLNTLIENFQVAMPYFLESETQMQDSEYCLSIFNEFTLKIRETNLLTKVIDWIGYINVLHKTVSETKNNKIRRAILDELLLLEKVVENNHDKNVELLLLIKTTQSAFYYSAVQQNTAEDIHAAIKTLESIKYLSDRCGVKFDTNRFGQFYRALGDAEIMENKLSAYKQAINFGDIKSVLSIIQFIKANDLNIDVILQDKLPSKRNKSLMEVMLCLSLYPENKENILAIHNVIEQYYLLTYITLPSETQEEHSVEFKLIEYAMRSLSAGDNMSELVQLVNQGYLPALIKLTQMHIRNENPNPAVALYLSTYLISEFILNRASYIEKYDFTNERIDSIKSEALQFISAHANSKRSEYQQLAAWYTGFIPTIVSLKQEMDAAATTVIMDNPINIAALILCNAEIFKIDSHIKHIKESMQSLSGISDMKCLPEKFEAMQIKWGNCIIYQPAQITNTDTEAKDTNDQAPPYRLLGIKLPFWSNRHANTRVVTKDINNEVKLTY